MLFTSKYACLNISRKNKTNDILYIISPLIYLPRQYMGIVTNNKIRYVRLGTLNIKVILLHNMK